MRLLLATFFVLVAAICFSPINASPKQHGSPITAQGPEANKKSTDTTPVVVNVQSPQKAEKEAEQEAKERSEKALLDRRLVDLTDDLARYTKWLAFATIALVIATAVMAGFAVRQARDMKASLAIAAASNEIASETAQRQLRAYISIDSAHIANFAEGKIPRLECKIRNFGQTPAYKYSTKCFIGIMDKYAEHVVDYYIGIFSDRFDFAGDNNGTVGPGGEVILRPRDTVQISGPEWEGLNTGDFFVYAFGRVQYTDAFDQERFMTYFMYGDRRHSDTGRPICRMHAYERGNDAN